MWVIIGFDGSGRTHRLNQLARTARQPVLSIAPPAAAGDDLTAMLAQADAEGHHVLVDDAHRLDSLQLRALTAAARQGTPITITRRPTIDSPELAELDEAVAARGAVEFLHPLDREGLAELIRDLTGGPAPATTVAAILEASAGVPAIAAAMATAPPGTSPPALIARLQRRLTLLGPQVADLARVLALGLKLTDDVLASATGLSTTAMAAAMRTLRDEGLLVPDGEEMIPAVAAALLVDLPPAQRRRAHDAVARAMLATDTDPVAAATQLRAARIWNPQAADVYAAAGERLRFLDPAAAMSWYDDAAEAGVEPARLVAGRAEASALLGTPVDPDRTPEHPDQAHRLALVAGAVAAHDGRSTRAVEAFLRAGAPGPALAVPLMMATGARDQARDVTLSEAVPLSLRRLAEAAQAVHDPPAALPLLIEAAEAIERTPPQVVLPDTPHTLGAVVAITAGDPATAEFLLDQALAIGVGGPVCADRHRLLLAWVRMRTGRFETVLTESQRYASTRLPGRERLLLAALTAGLARRSGDIASLRRSWATAEPILARQAVDLFHAEIVEELVVAAARLGHPQRITPILAALDHILDQLGRPNAWVATLAWIRLQVAVAADNTEDAEAAAAELGSATAGYRQQAQAAAAHCWAQILAGRVDPDTVVRATEDLVATALPWEASRLAGQAAIRTRDPVTARRLLERAREISTTFAANANTMQRGGLSDREVEVGRLVLTGCTHREIGAQLFLSPKTVEHHVARIRGKLGATNRAEMLAALREVIGDDPSP